MARFLSDAWFEDVLSHQGSPNRCDDQLDRLVIERLVTSSPFGEVRYQVSVCVGVAAIVAPGSETGHGESDRVDLTITSDWATACELAEGTLSAQAAVLEGRLRVKGDVSRVSALEADLADLDAVPAEVRARTTY